MIIVFMSMLCASLISLAAESFTGCIFRSGGTLYLFFCGANATTNTNTKTQSSCDTKVTFKTTLETSTCYRIKSITGVNGERPVGAVRGDFNSPLQI